MKKIERARYTAKITAVSIIILLYVLTKAPTYSEQTRNRLGAQFHFTKVTLLQPQGFTERTIRDVNPSLQHIAAWISSVGAGVALNDLDGDGLSNDLCVVDTRIDQAYISPAPDGVARYAPIILTPEPLPYNASTMAPMGCLPGDLNEDGHMDLVVYYWGRTPIAFMKTPAGYLPREIIPGAQRWYTNAAVLTDVDGDGHNDLVIGNYFADGAHILHADSAAQQHMQHSMSRAYNAGGTYFLLWTGATRGEAADVQFQPADVALAPNVRNAWTLALGAADLDGDLLPELYFANDFGPDRLLHNRSTPGKLDFALLEGKRGFTTPASKVVGKDSFKGMGVDFADVNKDGLYDFFVSNIAAEYALQESHFLYINTGTPNAMANGVAPFADVSEPMGVARSNWSWDAKFADFNNDGTLELVQATGFLKGRVERWAELQELAIGNDELLVNPKFWPRIQAGDALSGEAHNPFFVQANDGRYIDLAKEVGLDQRQISRGIATADVDGDGDMDFVVANQWEPSHYYRNDCRPCGQYLGLYLRLPIQPTGEAIIVKPGRDATTLSRPATGATVRITLPNGEVLFSQVDGGNGHSGKRSPEIHFGLGDLPANTRLTVEIRWRDGDGVQQRQIQLQPGWHTILLGDQAYLQSAKR